MKWEVCEWTECNTGGGEVIREYQGGGLPQLFLQSEGEEGGENLSRRSSGGGWRSDGLGQNFWDRSFQAGKGLLSFGDKSVHRMFCSVKHTLWIGG